LRKAKRFPKFFVIVAIIAIAASLSGCAQLRARTLAASAPAPPNGAESSLIGGINNFRRSHGLPALSIHTNLVNKARDWAGHMASGGCGTGGGGVPNICHSNLANGIHVSWARLGENVGMVAPKTNVSGMEHGFESSPPHAENMLNREINYVGVGVAYVGNYMYVAEEFMKS
jgi:uncharacterized protein YkwD